MIAQRGGTYLVGDGGTHGVVVDLARGAVSNPVLVEGVLARGYWEPFEGDPAPILSLVESLDREITESYSEGDDDVSAA